MQSDVPFVQLPCKGVVSSFTVSGSDLKDWFLGKNPLADYLARHTMEEVATYAGNRAWTRVIWDVTAVAWLLNEGDRFMNWRVIPRSLPTYDGYYTVNYDTSPMAYVYHIKHDALFNDMIEKLTK